MPMSRCLSGFDGVGDGLGTNDCNGHGTFCAGTLSIFKLAIILDLMI